VLNGKHISDEQPVNSWCTMRRLLVSVIVLLFFISMLCFVPEIHKAKAWVTGQTTYIRADGSVDPPTAPIQRDGDTYTLTESIETGGWLLPGGSFLVIERSNMTLNGAGHWLDYNEAGFQLGGRYVSGLVMVGLSNVTIMNMSVGQFYCCIALGGCSNITLKGNQLGCFFTYRGHGDWIEGIDVSVSDSSNNTIVDNDMRTGVALFGASNYNRVFHNNIDNPSPWFDQVTGQNSWDDGYPSGGNYWGHFYQGADAYRGPYQNETGSDGIIDKPLVRDENNTDCYPLVNPWHDPPWFPVASFEHTPLSTVVNEIVVFDATNSYKFGGSIISYTWDFGDGNVTTVTSPITDHIYTNADSYNASLTVIDNEALSTTTTRTVNVGKLGSTISISLSSDTITIRENTTISGSIIPTRENATATIWVRPAAETTWNMLTEVSTNTTRQYSYNWIPAEPGNYELKATWVGDNNTFSSETLIVAFTCRRIETAISISTTCP
jgi:PKD repeat protein